MRGAYERGGLWLGLVVCVVALAAASGMATADETASASEPSCGVDSCCGRSLVPVCRRVPVTKKESKNEYDMKCELVCVPGCGCLCDHGRRRVNCGEIGCCDASSCDNVTIREKKTLVKTVVDKEVDAWEYEVEWVCPSCCGTASTAKRSAWHSLVGWLKAGN